jgi:hypothetical protein
MKRETIVVCDMKYNVFQWACIGSFNNPLICNLVKDWHHLYLLCSNFIRFDKYKPFQTTYKKVDVEKF